MSRALLSAVVCLVAACAFTPSSQPVAPAAPLATSMSPAFLEGRWRSDDPANAWHMSVTWNEAARRFEGVLTRNGDLSAWVGFSPGELVWIATPQPDGTMREQQMMRTGADGVSTGAEWADGVVNLQASSAEHLVTTVSTFTRMP